MSQAENQGGSKSHTSSERDSPRRTRRSRPQTAHKTLVGPKQNIRSNLDPATARALFNSCYAYANTVQVSSDEEEDLSDEDQCVIAKKLTNALRRRAVFIRKLVPLRRALTREGVLESRTAETIDRLLRSNRRSMGMPEKPRSTRPKKRQKKLSEAERQERISLLRLHEFLCDEARRDYQNEGTMGIPSCGRTTEAASDEYLTELAQQDLAKFGSGIRRLTLEHCFAVVRLQSFSLQTLLSAPSALLGLESFSYRPGWMQSPKADSLKNDAKLAYRRTMRQVHPDKNPHPQAKHAAQLVAEVYDMLLEN